jgi:hypothetical protein
LRLSGKKEAVCLGAVNVMQDAGIGGIDELGVGQVLTDYLTSAGRRRKSDQFGNDRA